MSIQIKLPPDLYYVLFGAFLYVVAFRRHKAEDGLFFLRESRALSLLCNRPRARNQVLVPLAVSQVASLGLVLLSFAHMIGLWARPFPMSLAGPLITVPFIGLYANAIGSTLARRRLRK